MTQFVKVLSTAIRPPNEQRVIALLHDDALPETRQVVTVMQAAFNAEDHITANFESLWASGLAAPSQWDTQLDIEDVRDQADAALQQIEDDIATIDGGPTNPQVLAIVRRMLVWHRKEIRVLVRLLTD